VKHKNKAPIRRCSEPGCMEQWMRIVPRWRLRLRFINLTLKSDITVRIRGVALENIVPPSRLRLGPLAVSVIIARPVRWRYR
jgi:hypothetical protein